MNKALTLITLIFISKFSLSQDFKKFRFGLKISPNISWFDVKSEGITNDKFKMKFGYGLSSEYYFTPNYGIVSGFELLSLGAKLQFPTGSFYNLKDGEKFLLNQRDFKINMVQIPIVLKMKTNEIGYFTYFGHFGINTLIKTSASADDYGFANNLELYREQIDISKEVNLFNLGLNMAAGCEYNLFKETSLVSSISFHRGFTNGLKKTSQNVKDKYGSYSSQQLYNYFVSLNVGILF